MIKTFNNKLVAKDCQPAARFLPMNRLGSLFWQSTFKELHTQFQLI